MTHSEKRHHVRLYPEEVIGMVFLCLLLVLSWKFGTTLKGPSVMVRAVINAFLIVIALAAISSRKGFTILKVIRNWVPVVIVLIAYENLGNLVRFINPHDADPILRRLDEMLFLGTNPSLWLEQWIRPWFSEIMHSCYTSYYPFLPIIGVVLYLGRDFYRFRDVMLSVTLGFYIGYIGYLLVPAVGPRFYMAELFTLDVKGTTMLSAKVAQMINMLESTRRDCFPSLHTGITVIVTAYAWKYKRWLFWGFLPVNIGIIMATVYLRYHYVVDVFAGLALAAFCVWAGPRLNVWWYRNVTGDHVLEDYPRNLELAAQTRRLFGRGRRLLGGAPVKPEKGLDRKAG